MKVKKLVCLTGSKSCLITNPKFLKILGTELVHLKVVNFIAAHSGEPYALLLPQQQSS